MLRLADQTSWVPPEGEFRLVLGTRDLPTDAQLVVRFYNRVGGRILFGQSIAGENLGAPLRPLLPSLPVEALPRDPEGRLIATFPVSATTTPAFGVRLTGPGVYPVSVAITDSGGLELDRFVTHLVRLPTADMAGPTLAVSLIVPIQAPPAHQPDGRVELAASDADRLDSVTRSLTRTPGVPLTIDPTPETLDALAVRDHQTGSATMPALAAAAAGRQVMASPYVRLDLGAWQTPELADDLDNQFRTGASVSTSLLGSAPDSRTWIVDGTVTPDALGSLQARGVHQVVIPSAQLAPLPTGSTDVTFTQTFDVVASTGTTLRAVGTDAELAGRLTATTDPVLDAHLALADMAVLYLDRPTQSRGVVLALPADGSTATATLDALLAGLSTRNADPGAGARAMVSPVTVDDLFRVTDPARATGRTVPSGSVLVRDYKATDSSGLGAFPQQLESVNTHLDSYSSLVGDAPEQLAPLQHQVLVAGSIGLDASTRSAYLDGVTRRMDDTEAGVIAPAHQVVTLTAAAGKIPLTLENQLEFPIDVSIHLASEKLEFPEGNTMAVTLPAGSTTRVEIAVDTRASGAFPLDVSVRSPDGALPVASTRFTVRSTSVSGLGLALSIGAGLFLCVWWLRHFRSVRRARRLVGSTHPSKGRGLPGEQRTEGPGGPVRYAPPDDD